MRPSLKLLTAFKCAAPKSMIAGPGVNAGSRPEVFPFCDPSAVFRRIFSCATAGYRHAATLRGYARSR